MRLPLSKSFILSSVLCAAIVMPQHIALADNLTWQTFTYADNGNQGAKTASLILGVPETDRVQFQAFCTAGSKRPVATVVFGYNTGKRGEGARVRLDIQSSSFRRSLAGTVSGTQIEEGVSGVTLHLETRDPFWQVLAGASSLSYGIRGQKMARMGLGGSGGVVRTFLKKCKAIHAASSHSSGKKQKNSTRLSCKNFTAVASKASNTPITVTFVNKTKGHRGILWINFKAHPVDHAALNPGEQVAIRTYVNHVWMITDGPGNCLEMFLATKGVKRFEITKPNRYFGPE